MLFEWSFINKCYIIYNKTQIIIIIVLFFILVHNKSPKSVIVSRNPARIIGKLLVA
jgi:hypothetical protein